MTLRAGSLIALTLLVSALPAAARSVGDGDCRAKVYSINVMLVVQEALVKSGHLKVTPNGLPNPPTRAAITAYRKAGGLPPGDTIDPALLRALLGDDPRLAGKVELQEICDELAVKDE